MRRLQAACALLLAALAGPVPWQGAAAQAPFPQRPVRLVVPFAPGGGSDVAARLAALCMAPRLTQPVVVENRPGAGGTLGMDLVAKAPADGHTLGFLTLSSAVLNAFLYTRLPFDIRRDLTPVGEVGRSPGVLTVRRGLAEDMAGLRAAASRPGAVLTYGSGGNGTSPHLGGAMLSTALGAQMTHVPFRGSGPALTAVLAGQVDLLMESVPVQLGPIQEGLVRAIAVAAPRRDPLLPAVPTMAEVGLPGLEIENFYGVFAPAATPPAVVETLAAALREGLAEPGCRQRMRDLGLSPGTSDPAGFRAYWASELERWGPIVAASGAALE